MSLANGVSEREHVFSTLIIVALRFISRTLKNPDIEELRDRSLKFNQIHEDQNVFKVLVIMHPKFETLKFHLQMNILEEEKHIFI